MLYLITPFVKEIDQSLLLKSDITGTWNTVNLKLPNCEIEVMDITLLHASIKYQLEKFVLLPVKKWMLKNCPNLKLLNISYHSFLSLPVQSHWDL